MKTLPSSAGDTGSFPDWGAKIPNASQPQTKNKTEAIIVTNSIKTKNVLHQKEK